MFILKCLGPSLAALLWGLWATVASGQSDRPNIVIILADDLGYSDIGAYGSEIATPNLDRLAAHGLRFNQFYSAGRGGPTRAALLTGLYPHQVGMGWTTSANLERPAYAGELSTACVTLAEALSEAGYHTCMAGKWDLTRYDHLATDQPHASWPRQRGFQQFYGTLVTSQSYYRPRAMMTDNEPIQAPDGFYFTDAISSTASAFIEEHVSRAPKQPFFCYVSYTAPHVPLQADRKQAGKNRERYQLGWDVIRQQRFDKLSQSSGQRGLSQLPPRPKDIPAWSSLATEQQQDLADRMAMYATQVERLDHGVGTILKTLETSKHLNNTLIIFLSDNGANPIGGVPGTTDLPGQVLGEPGSKASYGKGWAHVSNTPFNGYKGTSYEGSIASPLIIHWPKRIISHGQWRHAVSHVTDIVPTCLEAARAVYPDKRANEKVPAMVGKSLMPVLRGMTHQRGALFWEHEGHRAIRQANWKLVAPFGRPWELYDILQDRGESRDMANRFPAVVQELQGKWDAHAKAIKILPLDGRPRSQRVPPELLTPLTDPGSPLLDPASPPTGAPSGALFPTATAAAPPVQPDKPNVIVIFCDDLGYGDLGCFGSAKHRTPNIDRMADEGMVLTSFYSTSGVCTPSRASLLTGCYPRRVNMHVNQRPPGNSKMRQVLFPVAQKGLHPNEVTIPEVLKPLGYRTACIGKWHLGDQTVFLPTKQGFDHYFGIPYSNDMGAAQFPANPALPLLRQEQVVEAPIDQKTLTQRYTEEALTFIRSNVEQPFFLYLPHAMPHNPVFASEAFKGKSANGGYGDAIEEIDWSTGQILKLLEELKIDERTLVVFTSDNGAAKRWGGSNAPLAGWKGSTMEGGQRVPCIVRWRGQIAPGAMSSEISSTMDLLPTITGLVGSEVAQDRVIDGGDIWPILSSSEGSTSPYEAFYYYQQDQLQAVRMGKWKLHLLLEKGRSLTGKDKETARPARLYDLEADLGESTNLINDHPNIVKFILALANEAREDLGDRNTKGKGTRPAGLVENPRPLVKG